MLAEGHFSRRSTPSRWPARLVALHSTEDCRRIPRIYFPWDLALHLPSHDFLGRGRRALIWRAPRPPIGYDSGKAISAFCFLFFFLIGGGIRGNAVTPKKPIAHVVRPDKKEVVAKRQERTRFPGLGLRVKTPMLCSRAEGRTGLLVPRCDECFAPGCDFWPDHEKQFRHSRAGPLRPRGQGLGSTRRPGRRAWKSGKG